MTKSYFYNRIKSIMRDNMFDRQVVGYRSGKIANKTLYKTQIENQTRVFSRAQERENKQYSISILLDVSGSMGGQMDYNVDTSSRLSVATEMVDILVNGLDKNNIRFSITLFGSGVENYKTFDKKLPKTFKQDIKYYSEQYGNDTYEGKALKENYKMISKEKGTKKNRFVMVFTDGQSSDDIFEELIKMRKIAKVFPFGIGLDISGSHGCGMKVCNKDIFMYKLLKSLENNISRG